MSQEFYGRTRYCEVFWRRHYEAWKRNNLN